MICTFENVFCDAVAVYGKGKKYKIKKTSKDVCSFKCNCFSIEIYNKNKAELTVVCRTRFDRGEKYYLSDYEAALGFNIGNMVLTRDNRAEEYLNRIICCVFNKLYPLTYEDIVDLIRKIKKQGDTDLAELMFSKYKFK